MKWTEPQYGSSRATKAGKILAERIKPTNELSLDAAFDIAGNWRSSHGYPLQIIYMTLKNRAKRINPKALVSQRLKRMSSVIAKLKRFNSMQLGQMQDLGGCRAVLDSVDEVKKLVSLYERSPCDATDFCEKYDHLERPKPDGYRGVHLVYRYSSKHEQRSRFNGRRIEIQIRSKWQHVWATTVETIDTFTGQAIKSGIGSEMWKRFFVLMGAFVASVEKAPIPPGLISPGQDWREELSSLIVRLRVLDVFHGLHAGMRFFEELPPHTMYTILILDSEARKTLAEPFNNERDAASRYLEIEKEKANKPAIQAVLVSVDSVEALRLAYPAYYLDTARFAGLIEGFMEARSAKQKK